MKISIIGGGYVGTVTGVCLAELGNDVTIVEIDRKKIDSINSKIPPLFEPGLRELLEKNDHRVNATDDINTAIETTDVTFICVGTPSREDGSIDLAYIEKAAASNTGKCTIIDEEFAVSSVKSITKQVFMAENESAPAGT